MEAYYYIWVCWMGLLFYAMNLIPSPQPFISHTQSWPIILMVQSWCWCWTFSSENIQTLNDRFSCNVKTFHAVIHQQTSSQTCPLLSSTTSSHFINIFQYKSFDTINSAIILCLISSTRHQKKRRFKQQRCTIIMMRDFGTTLRIAWKRFGWWSCCMRNDHSEFEYFLR